MARPASAPSPAALTKVRCIRCGQLRDKDAAGCPYCERFMYSGPHAAYDDDMHLVGYYACIWSKEPMSPRGVVVCETATYPKPEQARGAALALIAKYAATVRAQSS